MSFACFRLLFPTAYAVVHTLKFSLERMYSCLNCQVLYRALAGGLKWTRTTDLALIRRAL